MGGRKSNRKGYYGEMVVRDYLRKCGWEADRVPCSGSIASMPGDVKAKRGKQEILLECKNFSKVFERIYKLYEAHCMLSQQDYLAFVTPQENRLCCVMSESLEAVLDGPDAYEFQDRNPLYKNFKVTFEKIARMQRLVKKAEILVIRTDRKPLLFIRYR